MPTVIKAGDSGYTLDVNEFNQAEVNAVSAPLMSYASQKGQVFWFASDFISLTTTGSFSGILYIKNTHKTKLFYIDFLRTCQTAVARWKIIKNPTTGTLISAGTTTTPQNSHFTSGTSFTGTVLKGADAKTITDGDTAGTWINGVGHSIQRFDGALVLPPTTSVALVVKPTASCDACVTLMGWQK